ncbi:family 20 glycosylhydrolase [Bacteroides thetaiotaomicron]|nr:family 20 glycosylhydrolase [Bacteroides thetaiotaomicron]
MVGKTTDLMLCANNQKVYSVYQDIIKEISSLFPSDYIHLGGDEACYRKELDPMYPLPGHDERVRLSESFATHDSFFSRMLSFVQENNKTPMLWCELDNIYPPANDYLFPYPKNVTLVSLAWRIDTYLS